MFYEIKINKLFKYLGTTITNQTLIQEEINRRLISGNASYHPLQNLLSSHLPSKNIKIRMYKTIILPVVLYGCETWSLILREEHRQGVSEQGAEKNVWSEKRLSETRRKETTRNTKT
jgi:hypothetical protein